MNARKVKHRALMPPTLIHGARLDEALLPLGGLTTAHLKQALLAGQAAYNEATENDPGTAPGFFRWARTVRMLREQLRPLGWTKSEEQGISATISPDKSFGLVVASGDSLTGCNVEGAHPRTKRSRGGASQQLIKTNLQLQLFDEPPQVAPASNDIEGVGTARKTWFLLVYITENGEELRAELSLPAGVTDKGEVTGWTTRHLLEPIALNPQITIAATGNDGVDDRRDDDGEEDLVVPVRRKS